MLRDPHVIKRSDFWTKLEYSPAIEAEQLSNLTLPWLQTSYFESESIPYIYEG